MIRCVPLLCLLASIVLSTPLTKTNERLVFDPPGGILRVESQDLIKCKLETAALPAGKTAAKFTLTELPGTSGLIELENGEIEATIKPPQPEGKYKEPGFTTVQCTMAKDTQGNLEETLKIHILPAKIQGTLMGTDDADPVLTVGDTKDLVCDILPLETAAKLNGYWSASVDNGGSQLVTITNGTISPKSSSEGYKDSGSFNVTCSFMSKDNAELFNFKKLVTINPTENNTTEKPGAAGNVSPSMKYAMLVPIMQIAMLDV